MCGEGTARCLLIAMNIAIIIGGICDVTYGSVHGLKSIPEKVILIISGILKVCVCAPLGLYATAYKKPTMLIVYAIILSVVVVLEISLASVLIAQGNGKVPEAVRNEDERFENYDKSKEDREFVDWVQEHYKCCGIDGPVYWTKRNLPIPSSCLDDEKVVYSEGCSDPVKSYRVEFSLGVAGSTAITAVFKIIAILLALYLSYTLKQQRGYGDV